MRRNLLLFGASALAGALLISPLLFCIGWQLIAILRPGQIAEAPATKHAAPPRRPAPASKPKPNENEPPVEKTPKEDESPIEKKPKENEPSVEKKPKENEPSVEKKPAPAKVVGVEPAQRPSPLNRLDRNAMDPLLRGALPPDVVALIPPRSPVIDLAFTSDGKRLALARVGGFIELWDLGDTRPKEHAVIRIDDPEDRLRQIALSADGRWMASLHGTTKNVFTHRLQLWKLKDDGGTAIAAQTFKRVENVAFHPDSRTLIAGSVEGRLFDVSDAGLQELPNSLRGPQSCYRFNVDGSMFGSVVFNRDRNGPLYGSEVKLWSVADRAFAEGILIQQDKTIKAFAVSPDGKTLATAALDYQVRQWDLTAKPLTPLVLFPMSTWVKAMHFTQDGAFLIVVAAQNEVILWNVAKKADEKRWSILPQGELAKVRNLGIGASAFAPDGRHLAVSTNPHGTMIFRVPPANRVP